jgi:hypothetical protein
MEYSWLKDVGPLITAAGVCVGAYSLLNTKQNSRTAFEDGLASEYRQIASVLPTTALLGESLSADDQRKYLPEFYRYFDLTNNQVFLRQIGRISPRTWQFWADGIRTNLARPAFAASWEDIAERSNTDFAELRRVLHEGFRRDPKNW